jgi:hypothetical protein
MRRRFVFVMLIVSYAAYGMEKKKYIPASESWLSKTKQKKQRERERRNVRGQEICLQAFSQMTSALKAVKHPSYTSPYLPEPDTLLPDEKQSQELVVVPDEQQLLHQQMQTYRRLTQNISLLYLPKSGSLDLKIANFLVKQNRSLRLITDAPSSTVRSFGLLMQHAWQDTAQESSLPIATGDSVEENNVTGALKKIPAPIERGVIFSTELPTGSVLYKQDPVPLTVQKLLDQGITLKEALLRAAIPARDQEKNRPAMPNRPAPRRPKPLNLDSIINERDEVKDEGGVGADSEVENIDNSGWVSVPPQATSAPQPQTESTLVIFWRRFF